MIYIYFSFFLQMKELCALHSLNNLFQDSGAFTKSNLDDICIALSPGNWVNPHKSLLGTGNYDINVIMAALTTKGCGVIWFDKRKDPNIIVLDQIVGFILNVPSEYRIGPVQLPLRRKHWVAIRSLQGIYYNLDSKLEAPEVVGKGDQLTKYLQEELKSKDKELFIVVTQEVEKDRSWCVDDSDRQVNMFNSLHSINSVEESEPCQAFNPPGLKFIDQELSSMESSVEGNLSLKGDVTGNNVKPS
ncbi:UNVERIFIED_CONTAM: hypothetical protein GTU68_025181 [Idotea baltica]|nr:hypothetical protein [Idotea baltica]